jgi:hypothetical protein
MKKTLSLMIMFALTIIACTSAKSSKTPTSINLGKNYLNTDYSDAAPVLTQLAMGTINLENTSQAVDAQEASQLLFLWQAASSLYTSNTTADAEKTALLNQIQDTMTSEQIDAIRAMKITNASVTSALQAQGFSGRRTPGAGNGTRSANGGGFPQGGFPGGPPGSFGGGQGQNLSQGQIATFQAERQSGGQSSSFMNQALIGRVIRNLETIAGVTPSGSQGAPFSPRNNAGGTPVPPQSSENNPAGSAAPPSSTESNPANTPLPPSSVGGEASSSPLPSASAGTNLTATPIPPTISTPSDTSTPS